MSSKKKTDILFYALLYKGITCCELILYSSFYIHFVFLPYVCLVCLKMCWLFSLI